MKAKLQLQKSVYEEQIRAALHAHWRRQPAMGKRITISTMTML
jgi:hypothetical protein